MLRQITWEELFAVWDYEGKLESSQWDEVLSHRMLKLRLMSPRPRVYAPFVCTYEYCLAPEEFGDNTLSSANPLPVGKTKDIPFSPLELNANARVVASMVDDRDANLSFCAEPNGTKEVGEARHVLRRFAILWWYHHKKEETESCLAGLQNPSAQDRADVEDCLTQAWACQYFTWPGGADCSFGSFNLSGLAMPMMGSLSEGSLNLRRATCGTYCLHRAGPKYSRDESFPS